MEGGDSATGKGGWLLMNGVGGEPMPENEWRLSAEMLNSKPMTPALGSGSALALAPALDLAS